MSEDTFESSVRKGKQDPASGTPKDGFASRQSSKMVPSTRHGYFRTLENWWPENPTQALILVICVQARVPVTVG